VAEGDAVQVGVREGRSRMVGDHRGDVHRQLAAPPAPDQVGQAVVGLRGQDHHLAALLAAPERPGPGVALRERGEGGAPGGGVGVAGIEHHAHEEAAGLLVVVLLGVEDVGPALEEQGRDPGHDAGPVVAGERQDHRLQALQAAPLQVKPPGPQAIEMFQAPPSPRQAV
jgi:hypothetical protein